MILYHLPRKAGQAEDIVRMRHEEVQVWVADWPGDELTKQPWTRDFFSEKELLSHRCSLKSHTFAQFIYFVTVYSTNLSKHIQ